MTTFHPSQRGSGGSSGSFLPSVQMVRASMRQFEELQHPIRQHDKFRSVVVGVQPRTAHRIAIDLRSAARPDVSLLRSGSPYSFLSPMVASCCFFPNSVIGGGVPGCPVPLKPQMPERSCGSKCMCLGLVLRVRVCSVLLTLTSRTGLPSRRRRYRRLRAVTVDGPPPCTSRLSKTAGGAETTHNSDDNASTHATATVDTMISFRIIDISAILSNFVRDLERYLT